MNFIKPKTSSIARLVSTLSISFECRFIKLLMIFCGLCFTGIACAEKNTLIVGLDEYPPWNITTGKTMRGINVDIIKRLASRLELSIKFQVCPWKRCLKMMQNGDLDLIAGVLKRAEREEYMHYISPPYKDKSNKVFYLNKLSKLDITNYDDLYDRNIGVVNGAKYFNRFDNDAKLLKTLVTNDDQLVAMLNKKRLDTFIGTQTQMDYYLYKNNQQQHYRKAKFKYITPTAVYITLSKKSPFADKLELFEQQLNQMVALKEIRTIISNFYLRLDNSSNKK